MTKFIRSFGLALALSGLVMASASAGDGPKGPAAKPAPKCVKLEKTTFCTDGHVVAKMETTGQAAAVNPKDPTYKKVMASMSIYDGGATIPFGFKKGGAGVRFSGSGDDKFEAYKDYRGQMIEEGAGTKVGIAFPF